MVNGGLGEACASHLFQKGARNPFRIIGIPDEYTVTGSQVEIFNHYGISKNGIVAKAKELTKNQTTFPDMYLNLLRFLYLVVAAVSLLGCNERTGNLRNGKRKSP